MKKIITLILALCLVSCIFAGCTDSNTNADTPNNESVSASLLDEKNPSEIIDAIYAENPVDLALGTLEVDITDVDALYYNTGLSSADKISAAAVSESMFGSQAYSLVVVKVKDSADAEAVATEMKDNIDQRKWVCVAADDMKVCASGNTVMLFMVDSEFAETVTASDIAEAFKTICGGTVDVEF